MANKHMMGAVMAAVMGLGAASPAFAARADRREQRQQERIAQGVQNGSLTPRETAHLERKEARIDREVARDRAANGGRLTPAERARVERQQDRVSKRIYNQKHDAQHQ